MFDKSNRAMRNMIFPLIMLMFFTNCKENKSHHKENKDEILMTDYLTVIIKAKVIEDDIFEIYYAEHLKDDYVAEDRIRAYVQGSDKFQEISFRFPDRVYPLKLRIDLGLNRNESNIEILEIKLSTGKKDKIFSNSAIRERFRPNKYLEYESQTNNSIKRLIVDDVYDPFLLSGDLSNEIVTLFSN